MRPAIRLIHDQDYAKATATGLVVVDFRMDFCPACERMDHVLTHLAKTYADRAEFVALSVNQDFYVAQALGLRSAPTVLVKLDGKIVKAFVGDHAQAELEATLQQLLQVA